MHWVSLILPGNGSQVCCHGALAGFADVLFFWELNCILIASWSFVISNPKYILHEPLSIWKCFTSEKGLLLCLDSLFSFDFCPVISIMRNWYACSWGEKYFEPWNTANASAQLKGNWFLKLQFRFTKFGAWSWVVEVLDVIHMFPLCTSLGLWKWSWKVTLFPRKRYCPFPPLLF